MMSLEERIVQLVTVVLALGWKRALVWKRSRRRKKKGSIRNGSLCALGGLEREGAKGMLVGLLGEGKWEGIRCYTSLGVELRIS
jgi:hypothetical protein